jgi:hypothetical protein
MKDRPPRLPGNEEAVAAAVPGSDRPPLGFAQTVRREEDMYGENSVKPNRDDQLDEHAGTPEDLP